MTSKRSTRPCPQCRKSATWENNPSRPFCSERCRLIDLGQWVDEGYRIAGPAAGTELPENVIDLEHERDRNLKGQN
ncbi:MAG: DNA gyrase inhibitor YacG [Desulfuromonadales bacterium]|nr:DNA gyrase inhibitor YacG [Desulfuromonadales bacterium]